MPSRIEIMAEADKRGLLSGSDKEIYDEALRRGLVGGSAQANASRIETGYAPTEKGDLSRRAEAIGMDPRELYEPTPAEDMSSKQRFMAAADKGIEDVVGGIGQLAAHLIPGADSGGIDAQIADRDKYYRKGGLADTTSGQAGTVAGSMVGMMAPGGAGLKVASKLTPMLPGAILPAATEGGIAGSFEGMSMPSDGDNYWRNKAEQTAIGAGVGAVANAGVQSVMRGGTGVANVPRRAANAPNDMLVSATNKGAPAATEGTSLAQKWGVDLTPGQASGSNPLRFAEQRARESFFSSQRVAEGDLIRSGQYVDAIKRAAGDSTTPMTGRELQSRVRGVYENLFKQRSKHGRQLYGEIDRLAQGKKIVQPRNLYDELTDIVNEAGSQEGGDVVNAAKQAQKMLETIDNQGGYTAQEALGRLQNYSNGATTVFDNVGRGYDSVLKRRVYNAMLKDMEETATGDSTLGDMVREANKSWRGYSEQIESVKNSVFGKMMGKEAGEGAITANTVSPKQVIQKLSKMDYSDAGDLVRFMDKNMPDMLPKVRGSILNDAIDAGMMGPPSGGAEFMFNPNQFMSALGLKSGKAGVEGMKRLEAIFGKGTREWSDMQELIEIGRRMGDAYGKNFSGTSQANQFYALLRDFTSGAIGMVKRIGSTGMEMAGLRKIANSMKPGHIDFGNLRRTKLIEPPRITQPLSRAAGISAYPAVSGENPNQQ